jgi:hypothetical protein
MAPTAGFTQLEADITALETAATAVVQALSNTTSDADLASLETRVQTVTSNLNTALTPA